MVETREKFPIALVNPNTYKCYPGQHKTEHLGLAYLASYLRQAGYPVRMIDADALNLSREAVVSRVVAFSPSMLGVTCYSSSVSEALDIVAEATRYLLHCKVVMGGHHATFAAEEIIMSGEGIDCVVLGEGELTTLDLADALRAGVPLQGVRGLACRTHSGVEITAARDLVTELDSLPFPARDVYEESLASAEACNLTVISSRGCFCNCQFCTVPGFYSKNTGAKWRPRSPANIVKEVFHLMSKFGENDHLFFAFADDNFVGPGDRGVERACSIAEAFRDADLRLTFSLCCRSSSIKDDSLIRKLQSAGLAAVLLGIEAGSNSVLELYGKGCKIEDHVRAIGILEQCKVRGAYPFIFFNPYLTVEAYAENVEFLYSHGSLTTSITSRLELWEHCPLIDRIAKDRLLIPKASHRDVHTFHFADPHIDSLYREWSQVSDAPVFKETLFVIHYVTTIVPSSVEYVSMKGDAKLAEDLLAYQDDMIRFCPRIERLTYEYAMLALDAVQSERRDDLARLRTDYLSKLREILAEMDEATGISGVQESYRVIMSNRGKRHPALRV